MKEEEKEKEEEKKEKEKNFSALRSQDSGIPQRGKKGAFWEASNVLYLDLSAGYTCLSL